MTRNAVQNLMRSFGFTLLRSETYESLRQEQASLRETIASMQRMPRPSLEFPDEFPTNKDPEADGRISEILGDINQRTFPRNTIAYGFRTCRSIRATSAFSSAKSLPY